MELPLLWGSGFRMLSQRRQNPKEGSLLLLQPLSVLLALSLNGKGETNLLPLRSETQWHYAWLSNFKSYNLRHAKRHETRATRTFVQQEATSDDSLTCECN